LSFLPLAFGGVIATTLTLTVLSGLGISHARAARAVGLEDVALFRVALYALWAAAATVGLVVAMKRRGISLKDLGWRGSLSLGAAGWAVVATLLAIALWPPLDALRQALGLPLYWTPGQARFVSPRTGWELFVAAFAGLILVPPAEETLFRGYVLQAVRTRVGPVAALFLHNALFALYHLGVGPGLLLYMFVWSFFPALLFLRYRSVYPGMLMHFLNNVFVDLVFPVLFSGR
jgi:membrane protease YdiL (CAAX protease family)